MKSIQDRLATKNSYKAKVQSAKAWLESEVGKAWLTATPVEIRRCEISELGLQVIDVDYEAATKRLTKSAEGTWGYVVGNHATALTLAECEAKGLAAGPGNF